MGVRLAYVWVHWWTVSTKIEYVKRAAEAIKVSGKYFVNVNLRTRTIQTPRCQTQRDVGGWVARSQRFQHEPGANKSMPAFDRF